MSKINPAMFDAFVDPEGGHWIRIVRGKYENVVWRPDDIQIDDEAFDNGDSRMNFRVEFLTGPNFAPAPEEGDEHFHEVTGQIILQILQDMADREAAKTPPAPTQPSLREQMGLSEDEPKIIVP